MKDEEGTCTSKEIQLMKEEEISEPSSKRRKTEDDVRLRRKDSDRVDFIAERAK